MPNYKNGNVFGHLPNDGNFDTIHKPGQPTPWSGIYRCTSCGYEVVSTKGHPLPPTETCPTHSAKWKCNHGPVRWQLVASAVHVSNNA